MNEMQETSSRGIQTWKLRAKKEIKANEELGKRLKETKSKLNAERARNVELTRQLEAYQAKNVAAKAEHPECANCTVLQQEIERLHQAYYNAHEEKSNQEAEASELTIDVANALEEQRAPVAASDSNDINLHESIRPSTEFVLENVHLKESLKKETGESKRHVESSNQKVIVDAEDNIVEDETNTTHDKLFECAVAVVTSTPVCEDQDAFEREDVGGSGQLRRTRSLNITTTGSASAEDYTNTARQATFDSRPATELSNVKSGWFESVRRRLFRPSTPSGTSKPSFGSSPTTPSASSSARVREHVLQTSPKIISAYPKDVLSSSDEEGLAELCFPVQRRSLPNHIDYSMDALMRSLQARHRGYRHPDSTFVLTIASAADPNKTTYAICLLCPLEPKGDKKDNSLLCLCLLSSYPFFDFFSKILFGTASLWHHQRSNSNVPRKNALPRSLLLDAFSKHFESIMQRLEQMNVPSMGKWRRFQLSPDLLPVAFHRQRWKDEEEERRTLLLHYGTPTLFALISIDRVLFLLGCLCCERKVLLVSSHVNTVSACVLALVTLLHPLKWAGPVIPVLPPRMDELLEAPVPLIAGRVLQNIVSGDTRLRTKQAESYHAISGVVQMFLDEGSMVIHEEDLLHCHEDLLPECDSLADELAPLSMRLLRRDEFQEDFPNVTETEAANEICLRIHTYMNEMCTLAASQSPVGKGTKALSTIKRRRDSAVRAKQLPIAVNSRRRSQIVQSYVGKLQKTQMFSMFSVQTCDQEGLNADSRSYEDTDDEEDSEVEGAESSIVTHYEGVVCT